MHAPIEKRIIIIMTLVMRGRTPSGASFNLISTIVTQVSRSDTWEGNPRSDRRRKDQQPRSEPLKTLFSLHSSTRVRILSEATVKQQAITSIHVATALQT